MKLAIVLASGELEKVQAASIIASTAATFGEVLLFATMDGLMAFKKDVVENKAWKAGELGKGMIQANAPLFVDVLKQAKEVGNLKIYACGMIMDMLKMSLDEFVDVFDDVIGVTKFLGMVEDAKVLFI
ncbi:DsrE/DsrF/DrsH-like family protein [Archaeoglobus neptunius]|uniref:DsrE/DsrF/DrsH-like family protein n=1 Tax=Archaeoglobus neptunius TaxID=2798580 RepID=UPI001928153E|nr:DsrE/DsrF/DrsH-like family protein [Archaeoglobus neptunius]